MKRVQYIGLKARKIDNVAGTGLEWTPGQVHEVADDKAAQLFALDRIWCEEGSPLAQERMREATNAINRRNAVAAPDNTFELMRSKLQECNKQNAGLTTALQAKTLECGKLQDDLVTQSTKLEQSEKDLDEAEKELEETQKALADANDKLRALTADADKTPPPLPAPPPPGPPPPAAKGHGKGHDKGAKS